MGKYDKYINLIRAEYDRLDLITGINTTRIQLKITGQLTRKFGYFRVDSKGFFKKPALSIVIAARAVNDMDTFMDVIRHEYAHAYVYFTRPGERHVHDQVWKAAARLVGAEPKATRKEMPETAARKPYKYIVRCTKCGAESGYYRRCTVVDYAAGEKIRGKVYCKKCGGTSFVLEEK